MTDAQWYSYRRYDGDFAANEPTNALVPALCNLPHARIVRFAAFRVAKVLVTGSYAVSVWRSRSDLSTSGDGIAFDWLQQHLAQSTSSRLCQYPRVWEFKPSVALNIYTQSLPGDENVIINANATARGDSLLRKCGDSVVVAVEQTPGKGTEMNSCAGLYKIRMHSLY